MMSKYHFLVCSIGVLLSAYIETISATASIDAHKGWSNQLDNGVQHVESGARSSIKRRLDAVRKPADSKILVVVFSKPGSQDRRRAIRKYWNSLLSQDNPAQAANERFWLKNALQNIKFKFWVKVPDNNGIGKLKLEAHRYKDMHIYVEDKQAITSRLFRWILGFSRIDFEYVVKASDDTFLHFENLLMYLQSQPRQLFFASTSGLGDTAQDRVDDFDGSRPYIISKDLVNLVSVPAFNIGTGINVTIEERLDQRQCDPSVILLSNQTIAQYNHLTNMYFTNRGELCSAVPAPMTQSIIPLLLVIVIICGIGFYLVVRVNEKVNCLPIHRKDLMSNPLGPIFNGGSEIKKEF